MKRQRFRSADLWRSRPFAGQTARRLAKAACRRTRWDRRSRHVDLAGEFFGKHQQFRASRSSPTRSGIRHRLADACRAIRHGRGTAGGRGSAEQAQAFPSQAGVAPTGNRRRSPISSPSPRRLASRSLPRAMTSWPASRRSAPAGRAGPHRRCGMWCRSSLSGRADALYVVNDALGSFLLRTSEVIDQVPMSACDGTSRRFTPLRNLIAIEA